MIYTTKSDYIAQIINPAPEESGFIESQDFWQVVESHTL